MFGIKKLIKEIKSLSEKVERIEDRYSPTVENKSVDSCVSLSNDNLSIFKYIIDKSLESSINVDDLENNIIRVNRRHSITIHYRTTSHTNHQIGGYIEIVFFDGKVDNIVYNGDVVEYTIIDISQLGEDYLSDLYDRSMSYIDEYNSIVLTKNLNEALVCLGFSREYNIDKVTESTN